MWYTKEKCKKGMRICSGHKYESIICKKTITRLSKPLKLTYCLTVPTGEGVKNAAASARNSDGVSRDHSLKQKLYVIHNNDNSSWKFLCVGIMENNLPSKNYLLNRSNSKSAQIIETPFHYFHKCFLPNTLAASTTNPKPVLIPMS